MSGTDAAPGDEESEQAMDAELRLVQVVATSMPPPPRPDAGGQGDGLDRSLLLAAGLALTVLIAVGVGLLVGRRRRGRRATERLPLAAFRVELWRNGEATVLGFAGDPAADSAFACHLARLREAGASGALVLIDPVPDAIVALVPVQPEVPPWQARAPAAPGSP